MRGGVREGREEGMEVEKAGGDMIGGVVSCLWQFMFCSL